MTLEARSLHWLMYERGCHYVVRERAPRHAIGEPDVLGVMPNRKLIEVEIKRSMSDFNVNEEKWHVKSREFHLNLWPWEYWFMLPHELALKAMLSLPPWAGLLSDNLNPAQVIVAAPKNKESKRLSLKECVKMARGMSNYLCALEKKMNESNAV